MHVLISIILSSLQQKKKKIFGFESSISSMADASVKQVLVCYGVRVVLCFLMLSTMVSATQFKVGDSMGWTVPTDANSYNQWASKNRFKIGDSLLFVYPSGKDSVLQVSLDDYTNCKTSSPNASFNDGNTVFTLTKSGPYYFISGVEGNCQKNESMTVVVLADRTNAGKNQPPATSSPPSSDSNSSPPPPPPNAATMKIMSVMSSIGAFLGSTLFFF